MRPLLVAVALVAVVVAFVVVQILRPVPTVTAAPATGTVATSLRGSPPSLAWPGQGQAAFGLVGDGLLAAHGATSPTPLASVTKVMTADLILSDHPLATGSAGPSITVTATDVALYQKDLALTESVVAVTAGEQLTELQALQALLLPSGDNIATMLAVWDAGSEDAFVAKMNARAKSLGLDHTHYADASGVNPESMSTAADQVRLVAAAMAVKAFRSVVGMRQVTLPVAGTQYNVDSLLGTDGIVGVKTGWTTEAGGCFLSAADYKVGNQTVTVVGAVLDQQATTAQPSALQAAFDASTSLLASAKASLVQTDALRAGTVLGTLRAPWTQPVPLKAARSVPVLGIPGLPVHVHVTLPRHVTTPVPAGKHLGTAVVTVGTQQTRVPLTTGRGLSGASLQWRLTNL